MGKREAEIVITGDTKDAQASMKDLERETKKSFDRMSDDAEKESKEISDAFKKSGIRMEKDIKKSSEDARKRYEKIKKSGVASANDIKRAHQVMTAKIKKNNRELRGSVKSLGDSFRGLKTRIIGIGVIIASAFGIKAVSEAIKFEDALLELQKVLSDTDGEASQFADTAKELAVRFGVSSAEVLQSAADFKQAGFDINEAFLLTEASLKLVVASELEAAEASELLVRTLNGFKAPASEANRLINILNATSNKYATNVRELGTGMRDISGIASKMGFTFEETAGLLVPVISVFGSGSEAAQALKSGLLKLISTQKPVVDELNRLGISQFNLNGEMRSGKDILLDVSAAFQTMSNNQKIATTSILSGILQAAKMSEVFDGMGLSIEVTNNALKDTDSINKEVSTRMEATGVQIKRLGTAFSNMAAEIGTEALPAIKAAIDVLIPLFRTLGNFGVRTVLEVQKAWLQMSQTINNSIIGIAKVTDFLGITSGAADTIATDSEQLAKRLESINNRLVETSKESIEKRKAKEAELVEAKAKEVQATNAQIAASEARKQKMLEENEVMLQLVRTLEKAAAARSAAAQASQEFIGPLPEFDPRKKTRFDNVRGFKIGGAIPGYGGGDKNIIATEGGEHVIRKEAVKKLGRPAAVAFNRGDIAGLINALPIQKLQEGGEVKSPGTTANVNLIMGEKSFPVTADVNVAAEFIDEIKSINTVRGRKKTIF